MIKRKNELFYAAIICFESALKGRSDLLNNWLCTGQQKIVLRVDWLKEMENIVELAKERNVIAGLVRNI